jgi:hypothetical protein
MGVVWLTLEDVGEVVLFGLADSVVTDAGEACCPVSVGRR